MRDIDAADEWLEGWTARIDAQAARAARLAQRVAGLSAQARGHGASVTVGANGQVVGLDLDERMYDLSPHELSEEILAVMRSAQQSLVDQVAEEVHDTVGADSETGRAVLDGFARRFPAPAAEDSHG
ncbi:YbaB/EbfC family nucleoid-associated protein [Actinoplanes missouriensis]|uniref:YbaB/EbfC family nucleoid-associated protein n=1 Tax=Actinoplanes missouriensis TaxID=1866 RepID=UPI0012F951EC|nr:YbaB/EbfC family nucleoid-associated protein [Actinoplanes missouriensis]